MECVENAVLGLQWETTESNDSHKWQEGCVAVNH